MTNRISLSTHTEKPSCNQKSIIFSSFHPSSKYIDILTFRYSICQPVLQPPGGQVSPNTLGCYSIYTWYNLRIPPKKPKQYPEKPVNTSPHSMESMERNCFSTSQTVNPNIQWSIVRNIRYSHGLTILFLSCLLIQIMLQPLFLPMDNGRQWTHPSCPSLVMFKNSAAM